MAEITYPYAITITLNPKMFKVRALTQYKRSCERLNQIIRDESLEFVELVPELTKANNIHFHGTILLFESRWIYANEYLHEVFRKEPYFGFLCIKELTDSDGWAQYIGKQKAEIEDILYTKTFLRPLTRTERVLESLEEDLIETRMVEIINNHPNLDANMEG